jgi:hypothetical protein
MFHRLRDIQVLPFSLIGQERHVKRHVMHDEECELAQPPFESKADKATAAEKTN